MDIETSILIDKFRLERGYRHEQQEDEMLAKKFEEIKQVDEAIRHIEAQDEQDVDELQELQHRYDQLHKELTVFFDNDDIKQGVSSGRSTANMLTLKLKKEEEEKMDLVVMKKNRKKQKQEAQELVLVARVVTSYTYAGGMGSGYDLSTQYHLPASQQQGTDNVAIEQQLNQILYNGDEAKQHPLLTAPPLATLHTTPKDTTTFAHLTENTHPKMLNGFVPSLLGYNEQNNNHNQFDAIYPTHLALSVYQAINGDALVKNGVEYSLFDKHISPEATNTVPADDAVKNMYPFRCVLKTNAECMAPATIKVFFDRTATSSTNHIEHRGYTFAKFQKQREQEKKKAEKKKQQDDGVVVADEDLSEHIAEPTAEQDIPTQAFPQFTKRHDVIITVDDDAGNPVVWADGMILTHPQL